jgi:biotin-(acetyl-CoA carboxylase) ligase
VKTQLGVTRGRLRDIDETGALLLELPEGGRRRVLSGEVTRLRPIAPPSSTGEE